MSKLKLNLPKKELKRKIGQIRKQINDLKDEINYLEEVQSKYCQEYMSKGGNGTYREQEVSLGRGKTRKTIVEGRYYWFQGFKDTDTKQIIQVERSARVRENGVWDDLLIKNLLQC